MAITDVNMQAADIGRMITMNVRVTGLRVFWFRWKLASWLMLIAARVAGCGLEVELAEKPRWHR
jgi:hypothetical protein